MKEVKDLYLNDKTELTLNMKESLQKNYQEAMKDNHFVNLVQKLALTKEEAMKMTSKLEDTIVELKNCQGCKGLQTCKNRLKGHVLLPERKEQKIYFSYVPCKYQANFDKSLKNREELANQNEKARMKDIDMTGDKKRINVIKWIDQFFSQYDYTKTQKGLYLYGNFGSGKSFLINALFHELAITKEVKVEMVYVPEALRLLKDDWESYEAKMHRYQTADLLLLDDIGAEKVTEWGRDEVIGTILQYRMEHKLPTFFTSNMNLEDLENHFASVGNKTDHIKARRIVERIKQLSIPMDLVSENRRK